jgi:hypothetical protein
VRTVLALLLLTFPAMNASAQMLRVDRIKVAEYGIYTADVDSAVLAPGTPAGARTEVSDVKHAATTRSIPAQTGVRFGFRYILVGSPSGVTLPLHMVTIFPKPGLRAHPGARPQARSEFDKPVTIGTTSYRDYSFEQDWEIVPGVWTFQIWYQGRMLAEQKFTVVKQ